MRRVTEDEKEERQPKAGDNSKRQEIVDSLVKKNASLKKLRMEIKEIEDSAWEACGHTPKGIRQLAKLAAWDEVKRAQWQQLQDEIEQGRKALGLLAELPLGQAQLARAEAQAAQHHLTNPKYKASEQKPKRSKRTTAEATA